ncbi:hypothetical protein QW71_29470 [Paenibacillus sp. IHB B 3415]|uniref:hypothetical protein n=1 Tax=Paenibacillus sp. IHB B 3415 TaxID=867080 RepID=UPI0005756AE5|nr:hypothetical protein [Paenibacillus sp. IHB B 3415]KHL92377.1 hypothetical protein QW71_29470 [Paenibacillus sp. IHB B 3415]
MEKIITEENGYMKMGWKFLSLIRGSQKLVFYIEPMIGEPDRLYIPKADTASYNKSNTIEAITSVSWNRDFVIIESEVHVVALPAESDEVEAGTLESTATAQEFLQLELFDSDRKVSKEQAHELWCTLEQRFAAAVEGQVTIHAGAIIENSVFNKIVVPALLDNKNAVLTIVGAE